MRYSPLPPATGGWPARPARNCALYTPTGHRLMPSSARMHTALRPIRYRRRWAWGARDPTDDLQYFDSKMADCTDAYAAFVMETLTEAKKHCADPIVLVKQRLDFSRWIPEDFGTGDACIVADDVLHVIDLKYGLGILVDAERNPQMISAPKTTR